MKEVFKSGKPPRPISQSAPFYPAHMARAGLIGAVKVEFIIDKEGTVRNPYVVESNNPWFERPALDAIMKWRFVPAEINGRRVNTRVAQLIEFRLDSGGQLPDLWRVSRGKDQDKLPSAFQWDTAPTPARTLFPVYPFAQLKAGSAGKASISYIVGPNGSVLSARVSEATAPEFGEAVLAMIDAWHFIPAKRKDGTPCYATLLSEYEFRPKSRGDVPVSDEARDILRDLEKRPAAIVTLKDVDQAVKPLSQPPPVYPTGLLKAGQPGNAMIEFFIDKNGDAQLPSIVSSSAPGFGYAAAQAVATWRFEVPRQGGKPVVVRVRVPLEFALQDKKPAGQE